MVKALVFDFDGTIIDTETLWFQAFKEVLLEDYNIHLPLEEFAKVIGTTDELLYSYIDSQSNSSISHDVLNEKVRQRLNISKKELILRDGIEELLMEAQHKGLKIGIASSSDRKWIEEFLEQLQIRGYFSVIKSKDDVTKVKPDPELYIKAIQELGVLPHEAIAFEDSINGSMAAIDAGLKVVVIPNDVTRFLQFDHRALLYKSFRDVVLERLI